MGGYEMLNADYAGASSFWIIGAGRFGRLAAKRLLPKYPEALFLVVDNNRQALDVLGELPVKVIQADGVGFIIDNLTGKDVPSYVVPAVPVHLAFEWLKKKLEPVYGVAKIPVPEQAVRALANSITAETGKLYASYADFVCPDDCPEPPLVCTITGEKRKGFLYQDFSELKIDGYKSLNIRSHQLAPGVGGYKPRELTAVLEEVMRTGIEKDYLLSTACLCHGVMDSFRLQRKALG